MNYKQVSFSRSDSTKFFKTLNKRVNQYFKEKNIVKTGNWKLYTKAIIMFSMFFVPLILILPLFFGETGAWASFPISDLFATIITGVVLNREIKKRLV